MKLKDFSFDLPADRIARFPLPERDESRLMVVDRKTGDIFHRRFREITDLIASMDFMVLNHSRVVPVRLLGDINGYPVEVLMVKKRKNREVEALTRPARKFKSGTRIRFGDGLVSEVIDQGPRGRRILKFNRDFDTVMQSGYAPLPPYIKRKSAEARKYRGFDLTRYQTVYSSQPGSIAAPTAGLHFSESLIEEIRSRIDVLEINLEVGEATFQKIEVDDIETHQMGREFISISPEVRRKIFRLKGSRKLIAVGTTTVRALETWALEKPKQETFESELFIYPGFQFQMVDRMVTNFHLPESSLFIMVSAFAGLELMQKAYRTAIEQNYRFFSYGDAMFIV